MWLHSLVINFISLFFFSFFFVFSFLSAKHNIQDTPKAYNNKIRKERGKYCQGGLMLSLGTPPSVVAKVISQSVSFNKGLLFDDLVL